MKEADIMRRLQKEATKLGARLFRNNVGEAWIGKAVQIDRSMKVTVNPGDVVIRKAYRISMGLFKGSSDLIGWTEDGQFLSVEVKGPKTRTMKEQLAWIKVVNSCGGTAGIVKTVEELKELLGG